MGSIPMTRRHFCARCPADGGGVPLRRQPIARAASPLLLRPRRTPLPHRSTPSRSPARTRGRAVGPRVPRAPGRAFPSRACRRARPAPAPARPPRARKRASKRGERTARARRARGAVGDPSVHGRLRPDASRPGAAPCQRHGAPLQPALPRDRRSPCPPRTVHRRARSPLPRPGGGDARGGARLQERRGTQGRRRSTKVPPDRWSRASAQREVRGGACRTRNRPGPVWFPPQAALPQGRPCKRRTGTRSATSGPPLERSGRRPRRTLRSTSHAPDRSEQLRGLPGPRFRRMRRGQPAAGPLEARHPRSPGRGALRRCPRPRPCVPGSGLGPAR